MAITPTAETFDTGLVVDATPYTWALESAPGTPTTTTNWLIRNAPAWASGRVAQGKTLGAPDNYLKKTFNQAAGNGDKIRLFVGTDQSPVTTRNGTYIFYTGTSVAFSIFFNSDGNIYIANMVGANVNIKTGYTANTMYDITIALGAAGAISSVTVNGSTTNTPGTMSNSNTSVNTIRADTYNGGLTPNGHAVFNAFFVDTSSAIPNGTIASSGSLDGTTLGPNVYGEVVLGYTNGSSAASAIYKVERSADGGTTWAQINAGSVSTASGFLIYDSRPQYGSQPVGINGSAMYRVTASNTSGDQLTQNVTAVPGAINKSSIDTLRFSLLHSLISAQSGGYYTVSVGGEVYVGAWLIAMAYAYYKTGNTSYKTDAVNQFNYMVTLADSNKIIISPDDNTKVYRDRHFRQMYFCLLAARLFRAAGDTSTASTIIGQVDLWGKGWLDKINSAAPYASVTKHGWDASNSTGAPVWAASTLYAVGQHRTPTVANGHVYEALTDGFSGPTQPTWPTGSGATVVDADVTWQEVTSNKSWVASTAYTVGQIVKPTSANARTYRCITAGTSAGSEPTWPTSDQATVADGGVVWRCTSTTKPTSRSTYTNNGSTYPAIGSADVDLNQVLEEAAAWSLLTTDPSSAFFTATASGVNGSYQTQAQTRITDVTSLTTAYQTTGGQVPVGDPILPTDGRPMYDTSYGGFSLELAAVIYKLTPTLCHPDFANFISTALDWVVADYASEPYVHYSGTHEFAVEEAEMTSVAFNLFGKSNPFQDLWYSGTFNFSATGRWGYYLAEGPPQPADTDAHQERMLSPQAINAAISVLGNPPVTATAAAVFPATNVYPGTNTYPGQGINPIIRARISYSDVSVSIPVWSEVAFQDLRDYHIERGRGGEREEFDAGSAEVVLDNSRRAYDPTFNSSVRPMNRLWLYEEFNGEIHDLFVGYVTDWDMEWPDWGGSDALAHAHASDEFSVLSAGALPVTSPPVTTYAELVAFDGAVGFWDFNEDPKSRMFQDNTDVSDPIIYEVNHPREGVRERKNDLRRQLRKRRRR